MVEISILLPSRGPLPVLKGMLESLHACTADPKTVELLARLDADDPDVYARCQIISDVLLGSIPTLVTVGPRDGMGAMTVDLAQRARGRALWLLNDDVMHETYGWDRLVRELSAQRSGHVFFPDDRLFSPELACFPLLPKAHVDATDCYGVGRYERYLIDSVISDLYSFTLDRLVYLPQWKIRHLNAQPVSMLNPEKWFRASRHDTTKGYQPVENAMLERDQARYVEHVKGIKAMAEMIVESERVTA